MLRYEHGGCNFPSARKLRQTGRRRSTDGQTGTLGSCTTLKSIPAKYQELDEFHRRATHFSLTLKIEKYIYIYIQGRAKIFPPFWDDFCPPLRILFNFFLFISLGWPSLQGGNFPPLRRGTSPVPPFPQFYAYDKVICIDIASCLKIRFYIFHDFILCPLHTS